ncbi:hypothetical protein BVC71_04790 [Marivivens niveibacter]|uniref:DUF6456 domain-containing protein n=1 Tax=Marivivens niveibacter TaxID=1930667 RepID=A0A251X4H5_9RHOB|nr:DUF6456 domain-containing protein [Marivivens niveibacter]OUD11053.1 hypothetical protein BVC71_04790 [Marivivens niveibacter]
MTAVIERQTVDLSFPDWVPDAARNYLVHTEMGLSIRAVARAADCHASTILRQVRRFENRRDDPLVDDALRQLSRYVSRRRQGPKKDQPAMDQDSSKQSDSQTTNLDAARIEKEGMRIMRRLIEPTAVLAVARDMEMAVVVRDDGQGGTTRTAVTENAIARAMALREWISCSDPEARIVRYQITSLGRAALKQLMANAENKAQGFAEAQTGFTHAPQNYTDIDFPDVPARATRNTLSESPLYGLARRRDKDGQPFLSRDLVSVGERLREDFELANIGREDKVDWERYIIMPARIRANKEQEISQSAQERVAAALSDLGPGLGDVALRCCCYLEGLETTEKDLNWAARSGKIVLRIALQRLKRHYDEQGQFAPKIG